ncbi:MAG: isopenicillin N synthase family oxygenase [Alphaproteobacteria bacterium]|nr:isopenicillin N synthase family oxygenase [Alphaproteobacteria bacterium]
MTPATAIPSLDLSALGDPSSGHGLPAARALARRLAEACETIGFFTVTGHGVDPACIASMRSVMTRFFDLPEADKAAVAARPGLDRGYRAIGAGRLAHSAGRRAPPDLRETYFIGPPALPPGATATGPYAPNVWPAAVPEMEAACVAYYRAASALGDRLLALAALALGLPAHHFVGYVDRAISQLVAVHYPEQPEPPEPGQLRANAHSDFGSLTLLLAEDRPGGLQVRHPDGHWIDVRPQPDSFIVNIGDLMARWTNDRWRSTVHRVVNPPRDALGASRRRSIVFFQHPNPDAEIACLPTCQDADRPPRYPPTTPAAHLQAKLAEVYGAAPAA